MELSGSTGEGVDVGGVLEVAVVVVVARVGGKAVCAFALWKVGQAEESSRVAVRLCASIAPLKRRSAKRPCKARMPKCERTRASALCQPAARPWVPPRFPCKWSYRQQLASLIFNYYG